MWSTSSSCGFDWQELRVHHTYSLLDDIIFKIVFGSEANRPLLRALLNALLELSRRNCNTRRGSRWRWMR